MHNHAMRLKRTSRSIHRKLAGMHPNISIQVLNWHGTKHQSVCNVTFVITSKCDSVVIFIHLWPSYSHQPEFVVRVKVGTTSCFLPKLGWEHVHTPRQTSTLHQNLPCELAFAPKDLLSENLLHWRHWLGILYWISIHTTFSYQNDAHCWNVLVGFLPQLRELVHFWFLLFIVLKVKIGSQISLEVNQIKLWIISWIVGFLV